MKNSSKSQFLTADLTAEMRDTFMLFDKDCDGFVNVEELGIMLRAVNINPNEDEVAELQKDIDPTGLGKFDQSSFISTATKRGKDTETLDDIREALKVISTEGENATSISKENFKFFLSNRGDAISPEELDALLNDLDIVGDEYINIEELAKILMTK